MRSRRHASSAAGRARGAAASASRTCRASAGDRRRHARPPGSRRTRSADVLRLPEDGGSSGPSACSTTWPASTSATRQHRDGPAGSATSPSSTTSLSYDRNADVRLKVALPEERAARALDRRRLARRRLVRARALGHVRRRRSTATRNLRPPADAALVGGASAAQGAPSARHRDGPFELPDRASTTTMQEAAALPARGVGPAARRGRPRRSCSSTSARSTRGTHGSFRVIASAATARRSSTPSRTSASTIAAPRRWPSARRWHTYIPYTDRVDYLGGVTNNLPYVLAVEKLAGIEVPDRAQLIRVLLCELLPHRQPPGLVRHVRAGHRRALTGLLHVRRPGEPLRRSCEAITGGRMHPNWFRIGGVAEDLPGGLAAAASATSATISRRASTSTTSW